MYMHHIDVIRKYEYEVNIDLHLRFSEFLKTKSNLRKNLDSYQPNQDPL